MTSLPGARLASIHVYPVKSCAPMKLQSALVQSRGLQFDRRWMLTDESGQFVTGRKFGGLVRVSVLADASGLVLTAPGMQSLEVPVPAQAPRHIAEVWGARVSVVDAGDVAAAWFSQFAGQALRLVHADAAAHRPVDPKYAQPGDEVSLADGFPVLLLSQTAVQELTDRVGREMVAARFRPNLVISGVPAHAEDSWRRIRIGAIDFDVVTACVRCAFTTVDPVSGERSADGEPLRSLKSYRHNGKGITFGQNLIARGEGRITVGEALHVIE